MLVDQRRLAAGRRVAPVAVTEGLERIEQSDIGPARGYVTQNLERHVAVGLGLAERNAAALGASCQHALRHAPRVLGRWRDQQDAQAELVESGNRLQQSR